MYLAFWREKNSRVDSIIFIIKFNKNIKYMMKTLKYKAIGAGLLLLPMVASAQATETFFEKVQSLINSSIGLLLGIATLVFLVGVIQFVIAGGDEKKVAGAKTFMLWGIIGLIVMVAAWGIVNLVVNTLGLDTTTVPSLPTFSTE
ncbi:hypothetical protein A3J56_03370 [Candidatus Giovannonibacteria bacterium RIFCSPHIGHO2_02_FULL_46_20]|uniref:Uncharacterized protein n=1 Tax=Candidatus Giovannonibacteria bacterium RIFCSPHIGHO2_02_FULL_46_20 TaxID=1798338 RepID=A0A1F5WFW1_9BACT|nr:MAG: hypothetical protein A3J56_03370 [Candidatus Giovannonibacteria bacterium RIFCSPHIGHO2_02_FULL_46_20]